MSTKELAGFLSTIRYDALPDEAIECTKALFLDWVACALAGRGARPVRIMETFAEQMGPRGGPSELLVSRKRTSPLFAALVNGAASHVVEQDDLHNASILHPATVVFPAALAVAQEIGASGKDLLAASVAGYEAGCRVGEFLGRTHYKQFHMTGTAGTLGAAAAVGHLLKLDADAMQHALGSAGTQAAGLWEFLRDAADSKQLHAAKAAADGLTAAYLARDGFTGARHILEGEKGLGAGMSRAPDISKLTAGLGSKWAVIETSFKFHASCRHTHPSADALLALMARHGLGFDEILSVRARVYQAALDVLGAVSVPTTVHQSKFCMGFVLAVAAKKGAAGISDFDEAALKDPALVDFSQRVATIVDPAIDAAYPDTWSATVEVSTRDGRELSEHISIPKGDPGNRLTREELENKALRLARYQKGATDSEMHGIIERIWRLEREPKLGNILPH